MGGGLSPFELQNALCLEIEPYIIKFDAKPPTWAVTAADNCSWSLDCQDLKSLCLEGQLEREPGAFIHKIREY